MDGMSADSARRRLGVSGAGVTCCGMGIVPATAADTLLVEIVTNTGVNRNVYPTGRLARGLFLTKGEGKAGVLSLGSNLFGNATEPCVRLA